MSGVGKAQYIMNQISIALMMTAFEIPVRPFGPSADQGRNCLLQSIFASHERSHLRCGAARRWPVARTAARSAAPERLRLSSTAAAGGPPVAGEDPGGVFPCRARLPGAFQTMRASTRCPPRPVGVFSGIRPMASSAIRNQTWSPTGSSSAPEPKGPVRFPGGRSHGVRVLAPPGQSSRRPSMTIASSPSGHVPADQLWCQRSSKTDQFSTPVGALGSSTGSLFFGSLNEDDGCGRCGKPRPRGFSKLRWARAGGRHCVRVA